MKIYTNIFQNNIYFSKKNQNGGFLSLGLKNSEKMGNVAAKKIQR